MRDFVEDIRGFGSQARLRGDAHGVRIHEDPRQVLWHRTFRHRICARKNRCTLSTTLSEGFTGYFSIILLIEKTNTFNGPGRTSNDFVVIKCHLQDDTLIVVVDRGSGDS